MKSSFSVLQDNILTRKFGGTRAGAAEPYVTGYFFTWFMHLPPLLSSVVSDVAGYSITDTDIRNILAATTLNVTPPGGTLNKVDFTGLGGIRWAVPGNIDYGNEVTVRFFEFQGTPLLHILHGWVKLIRDYRYGITDRLKAGDSGDGYMKKTYAGSLFFWTTAPDGATVQYSAAYDGVFPNKDPQDLFTSDIDTVGRLDLEIGFNVDYTWHEPWVKDFCTKWANDVVMTKKPIISGYGQPSTGAF
jgi:hypothetical protein